MLLDFLTILTVATLQGGVDYTEQAPICGKIVDGRIQYVQPVSGQTQFSGTATANKLIAQRPIFAVKLNQPILQGSSRDTLSALGINHDTPSKTVLVVDPACTLYGKIFPGDILITEDGWEPNTYIHTKANFGSVGTPVQIRFFSMRAGQEETMTCYRKPLSAFQGSMQNGLRNQLNNW